MPVCLSFDRSLNKNIGGNGIYDIFWSAHSTFVARCSTFIGTLILTEMRFGFYFPSLITKPTMRSLKSSDLAQLTFYFLSSYLEYIKRYSHMSDQELRGVRVLWHKGYLIIIAGENNNFNYQFLLQDFDVNRYHN